MKLNIYITEPEQFVREGACWCYRAQKPSDWLDDRYPILATVEIDFDSVDISQVTEKAVVMLDKELQEVRADSEVKAQEIIERKQKLLALPGPSDE